MIIHNATVHSPVERFATALHIEDGTIVWMGDEDTAESRARAHPDVPVSDAEGHLLTPSFHNGFVSGSTAAELQSRGITAAHVRVEDVDELEAYSSRIDATGIFSTGAACAPSIHMLGSGATAAEMGEFLASPRPSLCEPGLTLQSPGDLGEFHTLLAARQPPGGRLYLNGGLAVDAELLQGWKVIVILDGAINLSLADLAKAGVPFTIGGSLTPWEAIAHALFDGPGPITARAAFNALTRGAWRLTPGQFEPRGLLQIGAPADLAVWDVEALAVQAPDEGAAFWSTDQRAGTPLLPALGEGESPPRLTHLYRRGELQQPGA